MTEKNNGREFNCQDFGEHAQDNEQRTLNVIILTVVTMSVEIIAGLVTGSMALLADGWHMSTHAFALGITYFAYVMARKYAGTRKFGFGTGKFGVLSGYTSALFLCATAVVMIGESIARLVNPVPIAFNQAILVAIIGLLVNVFSIWLLHGAAGIHAHEHAHGHRHGHDHSHQPANSNDTSTCAEHTHENSVRATVAGDAATAAGAAAAGATATGAAAGATATGAAAGAAAADATEISNTAGSAVTTDAMAESGHQQPVSAAKNHDGQSQNHDHNLRAAYLHVVTDAFTSVLAIVALLSGKYLSWSFLDPFMGIVGGGLIIKWSYELVKSTAFILLDGNEKGIEDAIIKAIEEDGHSTIKDLHVWPLNSNFFAAAITVVADEQCCPSQYSARLTHVEKLKHTTIEVHPCVDAPCPFSREPSADQGCKTDK